MNESSLTAGIQRRVKKREGWIRKIHQGIHGSGFPDLVVGYRGFSMFWEVKVPGNRLTKLQEETHKAMKRVGMLVFTVESTDRADQIMDYIDRRVDAKRRSRTKNP